MADYIDKNILCQAYIHVELPDGTTPERLSEIKKHLEDFATARGKFFVYPEVDVSVEFRDGSLKAYISIAGIIVIAIQGYGGFRHGIDYLYTDIKLYWFSVKRRLAEKANALLPRVLVLV